MMTSEVFDDENMDTPELRETIHLLRTLSDEDVRLALGVVRRIKVLSDSGAGAPCREGCTNMREHLRHVLGARG